MPDCILRVNGSARKVRSFLAKSSLKPCAVFFKGQPVTPASSRIAKRSGFNVVVSKADGELPAQATDALRFLVRHAGELSKLAKTFGSGAMRLDFGLWDISSEDRPWPTFHLPHRLVSEAGRYGIELKLSFYGPRGGE